ncbi:MAG: P-loop NTPase fold protein [Planctomycetota bacterium]
MITASNLSSFFIAGIIIILYHLMVEPRRNKKAKFKNKNLKRDNILNDPQKIIGWVSTEIPINDETEDLFNHKHIAKKIRELIGKGNNKNIGIIGGYGSGKSSIINLIISGKTKEEIFCKIEGWGFKENTAIEHILQLIIEDLKLHFDCLSISNLPKQYHEAMNKSSNNILPILGCFFQRTRNPINILEKIDSILECVNKKLIIVLEDIDRNINDAVFYNEIASFLNVTKNFKRISFIIAIGPQNNLDLILTRLCEHNEYIQRIDNKEVISVGNILTDYWHNLWPSDIIIHGRENVIHFLGFPRNDQEELVFQISGRQRPIDYISQLLATPRKLKSAMREVDMLWQQLHGEIDFRSFLLATILRAVAPEAYKFINEKIQALRDLSNRNPSNSRDKLEEGSKALMADWEQAVRNVSWHVESARKIICILFPIFRRMPQDDAISFLIDEKTIQGFIDDSITDYWKRINIGRLLPDETGDQVILKAIEGWRKDHSQEFYIHNGKCLTLSNAIFNVDGLDGKFEKFGFLLEGKEIRELASELFEKALRKEGNEAEQELCPGFANLWRLSLKKNYSGHKDWLVNEIEKALDVSLHFSHDLYYFWRYQHDYDIKAKTPTPELRRELVETFRKKFEGKSENLVSILSQRNPWGLCHIVYLEREQDSEEWGWLGQELLEAATINTKLMVSYIACLVSSSKLVHSPDPEVGRYYDVSIQVEIINKIFGAKIKTVMQLLSKEFEYPELVDNYKHAQTKAVIHGVREEAREWLKAK